MSNLDIVILLADPTTRAAIAWQTTSDGLLNFRARDPHDPTHWVLVNGLTEEMAADLVQTIGSCLQEIRMAKA